MVNGREIGPLFFEFNQQFELIGIEKERDKEEQNLIARNPVFYKKTLFRAFLNYSGKELEEMGLDEYFDCCIMLDKVLQIMHAPFIDKN